MSENVPPPATASDATGNVPGKPYYDKATAELQASIRKAAALKQKLAKIQATIFTNEGDYLENTPNGNIITGFDNYTKGTGAGAGASRRRGNATDGNRVFSGSDVTYNQNAVSSIASSVSRAQKLMSWNQESPMPSASSTPVQTVPTPLASGSFLKGESASNHATPTSSSSATRTGAGVKKNKKTGGEDSDTDTRESKKVRTGAAASRK